MGVLGKVKVGKVVENKNGKSYPTSIGYFRFTSNEQRRVKKMGEIFGEEPTSIPITFPGNDVNEYCTQRFELRNGAGQLVAYGDGEVFYKSTKTGFVEISKAESKKLNKATETQWSEVLILRFVVLGYPEFGLWEFRTKGKDTSIPQIISTFDTALEHAGRVQMLPFRLTVHKHKSNRAEANRQYPVVNLLLDASPEMVENIRSLGDGVKGLITPEKIQMQLEGPQGEGIEEAIIIED